ncbi:uncharacterized protein LOC128910923 isoform X2 [Rissa tridactyla]|uniref:uncharacterized protein LOC128910923 isoform X2 n=1 Tax=Rissa tridactyla TaxID=75485 RepID=UPI0023BABE76|nr:uncharacterized protein LOC128910923 isoform X2 [Rissa tridactyla]
MDRHLQGLGARSHGALMSEDVLPSLLCPLKPALSCHASEIKVSFAETSRSSRDTPALQLPSRSTCKYQTSMVLEAVDTEFAGHELAKSPVCGVWCGSHLCSRGTLGSPKQQVLRVLWTPVGWDCSQLHCSF